MKNRSHQKKDDVNEYLLLGASKNNFDELFNVENPWKLNSPVEQLRYRLTLNYIMKNFIPKSTYILELGCAEGNFTEWLSKYGYKTTAVDISENAIKKANEKKIPQTQFVRSGMIEYVENYEISKYNVILLMECFYYLTAELKYKFISLLFEKTNPEVTIFISFPVRKNNPMFPSENDIIELFKKSNLINDFPYFPRVVTLKGKIGILVSGIKNLTVIVTIFKFFKAIIPNRVNQMLFKFVKIEKFVNV